MKIQWKRALLITVVLVVGLLVLVGCSPDTSTNPTPGYQGTGAPGWGPYHPNDGYGPGMMWGWGGFGPHGGGRWGYNGNYGGYGRYGPGMMRGWRRLPSGEMTVTPEQARAYAQRWLDANLPGTTVADDVDTFYGYYTIHTLENGEIAGMLSVNGYTGAVWYHNWHGDFLGMQALEHEQGE